MRITPILASTWHRPRPCLLLLFAFHDILRSDEVQATAEGLQTLPEAWFIDGTLKPRNNATMWCAGCFTSYPADWLLMAISVIPLLKIL